MVSVQVALSLTEMEENVFYSLWEKPGTVGGAILLWQHLKKNTQKNTLSIFSVGADVGATGLDLDWIQVIAVTIWFGYRLYLDAYGDIGIRMKQTNISVISESFRCRQFYVLRVRLLSTQI